MAEINPTTKAVITPNRITVPASENILEPMPSTSPSFLNSSAAEVTELANPVTGTARPAPAKRARRSKSPNPVKSEASKITAATVELAASSGFKPRAINPFWMACPRTQIAPPLIKAVSALRTSRELASPYQAPGIPHSQY